jgi:hypothetical protein
MHGSVRDRCNLPRHRPHNDIDPQAWLDGPPRYWQIAFAAKLQYFWTMQLPPAAFNLLHNVAAISAD